MACDALARLNLPNTSITAAEEVAAGAFAPPPGAFIFPLPPGAPSPFAALPPFCRITGKITPVADSQIGVEVWLPKTWNHKLVGIGNGGAGGQIFYSEMAEPLSRGYAVTATDTGHAGGMADWSFAADREKFIDSGYRAVHEMTVKSKAVVEAHYGRAATRSYWNGCSTGGRQGLTTAHRFPEDYDGIVARAPAIKLPFQSIRQALIDQATKDPVEPVTRDKLKLVSEAAIAACDAADGVRDRTISDPMSCRFDPGALACKAGDRQDCLTPRQVTWARKIYGGIRDSSADEQIFPAPLPTSEEDWIPPPFAQNTESIGTGYLRHVFFHDPKWDPSRLDLDAAVAQARTRQDEEVYKTDPDLRGFVGRGGKLLLWHGWSDGAITPGSTINYYNDVLKTTGNGQVPNQIRLFMSPSVHHCGGGEGAFQIDFLSVIDDWVEHGNAPDRITASRPLENGVTRSRALCPYPQVATYTGTGGADDARSFSCTSPSRTP